MKIIISSKALHKMLERMSDMEVSHYRLTEGAMEFDTAYDGVQWMACETQFYKPNKEIYSVKIPFDKKQWGKLKNTLKDYFPEQPITMEFEQEDGEITITHCVLIFK